MNTETLNELTIREIQNLLPEENRTVLGDSFAMSTISFKDAEYKKKVMNKFSHPTRVDGYVALFCVEGMIHMEINLKSFDIKKNSIVIYVPGNMIRIEDKDIAENTEIAIMAVSRDLLSDVSLDFSRLYNESISILDNPCIQAESGNFQVLSGFHNLAGLICRAEAVNVVNSIKSLMSSAFYFLGSMWTENLSTAREKIDKGETTEQKKSIRNKNLFENFLKLVTEYHTSQRCVGFYADKLGLTPKYLSKIIKGISGRSAPEWIDSFVILEAKNMLKYSDTSIKEIVYKLNFPSQSVFYKFFKSHTGMTPSEYRVS